jgi:hypothetical protein
MSEVALDNKCTCGTMYLQLVFGGGQAVGGRHDGRAPLVDARRGQRLQDGTRQLQVGLRRKQSQLAAPGENDGVRY